MGINPAKLGAAQQDELVAKATVLFQALGCRDYARFDFRAAADGSLKLMEVNPNPAWSAAAKLAQMAGFAGLSYPQFLERIVDAALGRIQDSRGGG